MCLVVFQPEIRKIEELAHPCAGEVETRRGTVVVPQRGSQRAELAEIRFPTPRTPRLVSAAPEVLDLEFRSVQEHKVPIRAQLVGTLPGGLEVASVVVKPASVRVLVAEEAGKPDGVQVMTSPIYLPALRETTRVFAKIVAPSGVLSLDRRWPDVEVQIAVKARSDSGSR